MPVTSTAGSRVKRDEVTLETPFPEDSHALAIRWFENAAADQRDDFGIRTGEQFAARFSDPAVVTFGVRLNGVLVGIVTLSRWTAFAGALQAVFDPQFQQLKVFRPALYRLVKGLFTAGMGKLLAHVFPDNAEFIAMAESLGFTREGVLHGQTRRNGVLVDVLIMGLTKQSWEEFVCRN